MKRNVLICSILWISAALTAVAQAPQSISYQAVARNDQGHALVNQAVSFRLSIRQGSAGGAAAYSETHAVTTNEFGLANLAIGTGTVVSGVFSDIDWGAADYWLSVEMDPAGGSSYNLMGASQILSVPYALHSETAGRITGVFTEGRIPFGKIGGGELTESASLFWNSTSNRLGLGTSTPNVELEVTGKSAFGNSLSTARLNSGYGPRVFNLIDENANVRIWRYTNTSTLGTALELALGTNDDISNAANRWWDIYLEGIGGADEFLGFRRRTGGNSVPYMSIANGGNLGIGTTKPRARLHINGSLSRNMPVTVTADYTVQDSVSWIIADKSSGNLTLTLPTATSWRGREIMVKNLRSSGTVISASSNVVPVDGTSAGTAILPAIAGSWATLVSNGTNWVTSNGSANVTGAETKINAGTNVTVTGSGTVASPYVISASEPTYTVGENTALGGYVFYVTPDGKHGLVAATKDQSSGSTWYAAHDSIGNPDKYDAAGKNFVDWRFPTKRELDLMYDQRDEIGNFYLDDGDSGPYYYSGTPTSISNYLYVAVRRFSTGASQNLNLITTPTAPYPRVRAVRSF